MEEQIKHVVFVKKQVKNVKLRRLERVVCFPALGNGYIQYVASFRVLVATSFP